MTTRLLVGFIFFQKSQNCSLVSAFGATSNGGESLSLLFNIFHEFCICVKYF